MLDESGRAHRLRAFSVALWLFAITALSYAPVLDAKFIWDDDDNVTQNQTLGSFEGLLRIWREPRANQQYYPLTHTSFWLERRIYGAAPRGYHIDNVLLHAVNAVLVWLIARTLALPGALLAASWFALHPMQVESVAWVTERKNLLSGALYFGAALVYLARVQPARERFPRAAYAASFALFVLAMFAKTVVVSLPFALFMIALARGINARRELARLAPFFATGIALGALTAHLERVHVGALGATFELPIDERALLAAQDLWFYAQKIAFPEPLMFVYPKLASDPRDAAAYIGLFGSAIVLALALGFRKRLGLWPLVAALYFAVTLFPALGFFNVYFMRYAPVADHFAYLACLGVLVPLAALCARLPRPALYGVGAASCICLGALSFARTHVFHDDASLWADSLAKNPDAWLAHENLANTALKAGDLDRALFHAQRAAAVSDAGEVRLTLGNVRAARGDAHGAIAEFEALIAQNPEHALAHLNLGVQLQALGRLEDGERELETAVRLLPENALAQNDLANLLARLHDRRALEHYAHAVALAPEIAVYHANFAAALQASGELPRAIAEFRAALARDPTLVKVRNNLGVALATTGELDLAEREFRAALAREPENADAKANLARTLELKSQAHRTN